MISLHAEIAASLPSPAIVVSLVEARAAVKELRLGCRPYRTSVLFSIKASSLPILLAEMYCDLDGFSTSSLFEARLASEFSTGGGIIQYVGTGVPQDEIGQLMEVCDRISANSLPQWVRLAESTCRSSAELGIRLNPGYSTVNDFRYDSCRPHSKLGVPPRLMQRAWREGDLKGISGIHFHTACECRSWEPLLRTVKVIEKRLAPMMHELEWINLGGGYQWDEATDFGPLQEAIELLTNSYGLEVFLEPGHGIVNSAGSLHASVVDLFESDGKMVAILDTTVNHLPEVYEYQYEPDVAEHVDGAPYECILAGCSCLAGDVFGEYAFEEPLEIGSRVVFENVGAYSLVKANMFNGINLPSIYILQEDGRLELIREFTYEDYLARCGGEAHAVMPARI